LTAVTALAVMLAAVAPIAAVAAVGAAVAQVPAMIADGLASPAGRAAQWWGVAASALFLLQSAAGTLQAAATTALGERIDALLQRDLMSAVLTPTGIGHLEDPETLDLVNVGRETFRAAWARPGRLASTVSGLLTGRVILVGACVVLARLHPVLGIALLAAGLWAAYEDKAASRQEAAHHYGSTELSRRTEYYFELGINPPTAKEVRVFGLRRFLLDRYAAFWRRSMVDVFAPAGRRPVAAAAVLGTVVLVGLAVVVSEAMGGRIGIGPAAAYAQALMVSVGGIQRSSWSGLQTELALATLNRYEDAVAAVRSAHYHPVPAGTRPADDLPRTSIRFEGVSFSYPGSGTKVLHELDLVVPAGRSLAIVGVNGAGKTTLVKLLCRLYEPTSGRLTIDGVDLSAVDVQGWRRRLAAVFQDSTRFALPARANVEFGRVAAAGDQAGVEAAGADAGIADTVAGLPEGWDTPLSSEYAGGVDLSGGEWQKMALARALFAVRHGAGVLILDEPAAHLDARAEARLYERFLTMTEGLTTIVISHRFSTVRQASSIAVIDGGRVIEQGTHDELIARGGAYAEMFRLQAARFAGPGEPVGTER
jgi:ATP-binding cassette subfamily B protein